VSLPSNWPLVGCLFLMGLPYIQHRLCRTLWAQNPEPHGVIGRSLLLIFLVMRHQVSRGCPSTESGAN